MNISKSFSACNSRNGFISYFDKIFYLDDYIGRYIIKGGPGTGKSTLMNKVAEKAVELGYDVRLYYCSSDVSSLDGIVIPEKKICIIDGTAPHSCDTKYPGCVDRILDMSAFRDDGILSLFSDDIKELFDLSAEYYKKGYSVLASAGNVLDSVEKYAFEHIDFEKLEKNCKNYVKRFGSNEKCSKELILSSISADGKYTIENQFPLAENVYLIDDSYLISNIFIDTLAKYVQNAVFVLDPFDPMRCEAVYFESSRTLFTKNKELISGNFKTVYMRRFAKDTVKESSNSVRLLIKLAKILMKTAEDNFKKAKEVHFKLESIYSQAMDFDQKEEWTEDFVSALFSE